MADEMKLFTGDVDRMGLMSSQSLRAARDEAQKLMAERFDIKAFHDRVLEDGGVPLTYLREKIGAWATGPTR